MSEHSIAIPPFPRGHRLPAIRLAASAARGGGHHDTSELREACLVGGFALAFCWVAAELAIAFGAG